MTRDAMGEWPRFSVVTWAFNQRQYIRETIESVLAQDYPNFEHIVIDDGADQETRSILAEYPHLRVVRSADGARVDAINEAFRLATGQIYCFLSSDDTFEPDALRRVALEIDPASGRHVVMGRCRLVDEDGRFIGLEHPTTFEHHRRILEIWKGLSILPQPTVFWTSAVWQKCGPLDRDVSVAVDYDLYCRLSRACTFHVVDHVIANHRLHTRSTVQGVDDALRFAESVEISRRYWAPVWAPAGVAIRSSYLRHLLNRRGRAYRTLQTVRWQWQTGRRTAALSQFALGTALGPDVAFRVLAGPAARRTKSWVRRQMLRALHLVGRRAAAPQTKTWLKFRGVHADQWVGPVLEREVRVPEDVTNGTLRIEGDTVPDALSKALVLDVTIGPSVRQRIEVRGATFAHDIPLAMLSPGSYRLHVRANGFIVPHDRWGNGDFRPLSYRLIVCHVIDPTERLTERRGGDL